MWFFWSFNFLFGAKRVSLICKKKEMEGKQRAAENERFRALRFKNKKSLGQSVLFFPPLRMTTNLLFSSEGDWGKKIIRFSKIPFFPHPYASICCQQRGKVRHFPKKETKLALFVRIWSFFKLCFDFAFWHFLFTFCRRCENEQLPFFFLPFRLLYLPCTYSRRKRN